MNKRIISVFVFGAALFSMHAQDGKGGINEAMLKQIQQSYQGTVADKALRNAICNNDIRKLAVNRDNLKGMDTHFSVKCRFKGHHRPEVIRALLVVYGSECDARQNTGQL